MGSASRRKAGRRAQAAAREQYDAALAKLRAALPAAGEPVTIEVTMAMRTLYRAIFDAIVVDQTVALQSLPQGSEGRAALEQAIARTRSLERALLTGADRAHRERAS